MVSKSYTFDIYDGHNYITSDNKFKENYKNNLNNNFNGNLHYEYIESFNKPKEKKSKKKLQEAKQIAKYEQIIISNDPIPNFIAGSKETDLDDLFFSPYQIDPEPIALGNNDAKNKKIKKKKHKNKTHNFTIDENIIEYKQCLNNNIIDHAEDIKLFSQDFILPIIKHKNKRKVRTKPADEYNNIENDFVITNDKVYVENNVLYYDSINDKPRNDIKIQADKYISKKKIYNVIDEDDSYNTKFKGAEIKTMKRDNEENYIEEINISKLSNNQILDNESIQEYNVKNRISSQTIPYLHKDEINIFNIDKESTTKFLIQPEEISSNFERPYLNTEKNIPYNDLSSNYKRDPIYKKKQKLKFKEISVVDVTMDPKNYIQVDNLIDNNLYFNESQLTNTDIYKNSDNMLSFANVDDNFPNNNVFFRNRTKLKKKSRLNIKENSVTDIGSSEDKDNLVNNELNCLDNNYLQNYSISSEMNGVNFVNSCHVFNNVPNHTEPQKKKKNKKLLKYNNSCNNQLDPEDCYPVNDKIQNLNTNFNQEINNFEYIDNNKSSKKKKDDCKEVNTNFEFSNDKTYICDDDANIKYLKEEFKNDENIVNIKVKKKKKSKLDLNSNILINSFVYPSNNLQNNDNQDDNIYSENQFNENDIKNIKKKKIKKNTTDIIISNNIIKSDFSPELVLQNLPLDVSQNNTISLNKNNINFNERDAISPDKIKAIKLKKSKKKSTEISNELMNVKIAENNAEQDLLPISNLDLLKTNINQQEIDTNILQNEPVNWPDSDFVFRRCAKKKNNININLDEETNNYGDKDLTLVQLYDKSTDSQHDPDIKPKMKSNKIYKNQKSIENEQAFYINGVDENDCLKKINLIKLSPKRTTRSSSNNSNDGLSNKRINFMSSDFCPYFLKPPEYILDNELDHALQRKELVIVKPPIRNIFAERRKSSVISTEDLKPLTLNSVTFELKDVSINSYKKDDTRFDRYFSANNDLNGKFISETASVYEQGFSSVRDASLPPKKYASSLVDAPIHKHKPNIPQSMSFGRRKSIIKKRRALSTCSDPIPEPLNINDDRPSFEDAVFDSVLSAAVAANNKPPIRRKSTQSKLHYNLGTYKPEGQVGIYNLDRTLSIVHSTL